MDLQEATHKSDSEQTTSGLRALGVFVASAVGYGIGYYIAIAILFSIFGLNNASDAPWEIATIGLGAVLAGVAGSLASPRSGWRPLKTTSAIAVVALLVGLVFDIGFDYGIGTGVVAALGAAFTAYASHPE